MRIRLFLMTLVAAASATGFHSANSASAAATTLPNLLPKPARDIQIGPADGGGPQVLRFATAIANRGVHDFDILGEVRTGSVNALNQPAVAKQCTEWAAKFVCGARTAVGTMEWHPSHGHWHLADMTQYELWATDGSGTAIGTAPVSTSGKVSFCLLNSERDTGHPGPWGPAGPLPHPVYARCEAGNQGISAGWQDLYGQTTPGQQLPIAGLADGVYELRITVDPDGKLLQTTRTDDVSRVLVRLGTTAGKRTVAVV